MLPKQLIEFIRDHRRFRVEFLENGGESRRDVTNLDSCKLLSSFRIVSSAFGQIDSLERLP